ncbi:MAG: helicase-related protein, partial [Chloroflexota bacterium]
PNSTRSRNTSFFQSTQNLESAHRAHFQRDRILRWDRDTASNPQKHENILARFAEGEADILVGTQMIAKGLDIPFVTLVGVVSADPGLALPDFRAQERAFQLLTQVAGRAGRSILGGHVIIQTYQPDHPSIIAAAQHDYASFYQTEITARREMGYPPFRRLGRILVQDTHPIEAERQIRAAAEQLVHRITKENLTDTHLIGPAPCFFSRIDRHYRWQVLVRSSDPAQVLNAIQARNGWYIDIDPVDIL